MISMAASMSTTGASFVLMFLLPGCFSYEDRLDILPMVKQQKIAVGKSTVLTCQPNVELPHLISDLQWRDPRDRVIDRAYPGQRPEMYTEPMPGTQSLLLYITSITRAMAGDYRCLANYANTKQLEASVRIDTYVAITWQNAEEFQYPTKGTDFKVMCEVTAEPAPTVDWFRDSSPILNGERYVIKTDGLIIKNVTEMDDGTYTCRAVVLATGELSEKNIKVEVHTKPEMESRERQVEIREGEVATISCKARGKPVPKYMWTKANNKENLADAPRFQVDEVKGTLTINKVEANDYGEYICSAHNGAGQSDIHLDVEVVVPPRIYELLNQTAPVKTETRIVCKATGRPAPAVTFRKRSRSDPYIGGIQPDDDRIILETQNIVENDNLMHTMSTLIISNIKRPDDGLYECIASNKGGEARKNGHLTVWLSDSKELAISNPQFPPTFEAMPKVPVWSWNGHPVNLSCLAEGIPNATIKWRSYNTELVETPQIRIYGSGPFSYISVTPTDPALYTQYTCVATNPYGEDEYTVQLREARVPGSIPQVRQVEITATTVTFAITDPPTYDGPPITAYVAEYKDQRNYDYSLGKNRTWSVNSPYIVEELIPTMTYTFRFAAVNKVGRGPFDREIVVIMPKRGPPERPKLLVTASEDGVNELVAAPFADHYELRWKIPPNNGEPIDMYEVITCPVQKVNGEWQILSENECTKEELRSYELISHELRYLRPDTRYRITLRARNVLGYSLPAELYMQTAIGLAYPGFQPRILSSTAIVGIVVCSILLFLLLVDLILYCTKKQGLIALTCGRNMKKKAEEDTKLGRDEKEPLKEDAMKRNSRMEFDGSRVYATSGNIIGKNSAV